MPELPEVQSIVNGLQKDAVGQCVDQINVLRTTPLGDLPADDFCDALENQKIEKIERRAKYLLFAFSNHKLMAVHLRMTGKFVISDSQDLYHEELRWVRVQFALQNQKILNFHDKRCLGTIELFDSMQEFDQQKKLGIEPLHVTALEVENLLSQSQAPIKSWLLDQNKIVGIGNIYASEILFQSKISPVRLAKSLTKKEAYALTDAIHAILTKAIEYNGTSISDFRGVDEKTGEFQNFLKVYGRRNENCFHCDTALIYIRQQQRSSFYCPSCQN